MDNPSATGESSDAAGKNTTASDASKATETAKTATASAQVVSAVTSPAVTDALAIAIKAAGLGDATAKPREVLSTAIVGRPWEQLSPAIKTAARGDARKLIDGAKDPLGILQAAGYGPVLAAQLLRDLGRR